MTNVVYRPAAPADLPALLELEQACFDSDRLSRRSFRHFLHQQQHCFIVAEQDKQLVAYALVLLHRGTQLARLYSIAVDKRQRGQGIAGELLRMAEQACADSGRISMRLEVRADNPVAIRLYEKLGYHPFGEYKDYYEDHTDALRLQKRILFPRSKSLQLAVPYYSQQTDFTCGPAALMMIMHALNPERVLSTIEELRIWREATTIYMMAGHGGCSPVGLALSAVKRGFAVETYLSSTDIPFIDSVRDPEKKRVIELVHNDLLDQLQAAGGVVQYGLISQQMLEDALKNGSLPLILISTYRFDEKKIPHWVVVSAMDERFIYIHDPYIYIDDYRFALDNQYLPISRSDFDKMAQFGQQRLRTGLIISRTTGATKPQT